LNTFVPLYLSRNQIAGITPTNSYWLQPGVTRKGAVTSSGGPETLRLKLHAVILFGSLRKSRASPEEQDG
jgi:hypothetical protein